MGSIIEKNSGHYFTNPNNALLQAKSFKITIHLHCLIPPKMGNIMIPEKDLEGF